MTTNATIKFGKVKPVYGEDGWENDERKVWLKLNGVRRMVGRLLRGEDTFDEGQDYYVWVGQYKDFQDLDLKGIELIEKAMELVRQHVEKGLKAQIANIKITIAI